MQDEASGKRMRLKGGIYDKGFDAEKLVRADRGAEGGGGGDPDEPPGGAATDSEERIREHGQRVQKLWEQVASIRQGRGRAHQKRYRRRPKSPAVGFRKETVVESDDRGSVGGRGGAGIGGPDQLPGSGHPAEDRDAAGTGGTDRAAERDAETAAGRHVGASICARWSTAGSWCCRKGRSRIRSGPWTAGLPSGYRASEGSL